MKANKSQNWLLLALFLVIGAVLGGVLGDVLAKLPLLADFAPYLTKHYVLLNIPPLTVDLYIAQIVGGLVLQPSLMSIVGMLLGIFIYRRF
ncbi:MAG: DUF4321 domain-containing protein [Sporomusaceae bacterium]|nr:DUF4321 domain-containing protein [Sporomusaceae bacterium]